MHISKQFFNSGKKELAKMLDKTGINLLKDNYLNKGTAFTNQERDQFKLHGYLPAKVETIEEQAARCYDKLTQPHLTPVEKYGILQDIQDDNETLFFKLILDHLEEFAPIVYTPTIGKVCQTYSQIYKRPRGIWLNSQHQGRIEEILRSLERDDIRLIVVTDNQRILGLGDLGAGGIGIPIGKLNLYTAGAGIKPEHCLPISIDIGCNKEDEILKSPHYFGENNSRLSGEKYDAFIEEFVVAVFKLWPNCLLQWEDFFKGNAIAILDRYKERVLSFNDDIQGTAAVGVAGVLASYRHLGKDIKDAKIAMLGGGAAGTGIMSLLQTALEDAGNTNPKENLVVLDSKGIITESRPGGFGTDSFKAKFAKTGEQVEKIFGEGTAGEKHSLESVIEHFKPDVLIGTSGVPNTFTEEAIRTMAKYCDKPVIMPFSNPTSQCEALPSDIVKWTNEQAIIATGSPFEPVPLSNGKSQRIGQGNNVFVFPGIGLGALFAKSKLVTDNMLYASAKALAHAVEESDLAELSVYPKINKLRSVTVKVAAEGVRQAKKDGVCQIEFEEETLESEIEKFMWKPEYKSYL